MTTHRILKCLILFTNVCFTTTLTTTTTQKAPTCSGGTKPLLDEDLRLFSCRRGCPDTFYCENEHCCPNTTAILSSLSTENHGLRDKKNIESQLDSSAELERIMSCERFPYKLSCPNSTSQPLTKWYFDIQTLSCELYPFGMCEDDPLDKLALRTKSECEERCDVAKVKEALENLNGNSLEENVEREAPNVLPRVPSASQIAIDDVIQESKHIRGRPFAIEPPTDLVHVIHVKSDNHRARFHKKSPENSIENSQKLIEIDENQLLTTTVEESTVPTVTLGTVTQPTVTTVTPDTLPLHTVPTVTSDILEILEDAGDDPEGSGQIRITVTEQSEEVLENSGLTSSGTTSSENEKFESSEKLVLTSSENGVFEKSGKFEKSGNSEIVQQNEIASSQERQQRKKSVVETEDNSFDRFYQKNKELVSCSATPYRLLCPSGSASQFVYRWEKVGGVCQSFPYGYCLHEQNIPHPRTQAECEQFCD